MGQSLFRPRMIAGLLVLAAVVFAISRWRDAARWIDDVRTMPRAEACQVLGLPTQPPGPTFEILHAEKRLIWDGGLDHWIHLRVPPDQLDAMRDRLVAQAKEDHPTMKWEVTQPTGPGKMIEPSGSNDPRWWIDRDHPERYEVTNVVGTVERGAAGSWFAIDRQRGEMFIHRW